MSEPIPTYAQESYAILRTRFAGESFPADYLSWFVSRSMTKKVLHVLEHARWIRRMGRGRYVCVNAEEVFESMIEFKVPGLLQRSGMEYAYSDASAVEVWTDYSYIQRSREHSPYYVKVLRKDLKRWVEYFRRHRVRVFVSRPEPALGEFVILKPVERLDRKVHNDLPVERLDAVVRYCEKYVQTFEYPLAYLEAKFKVRPKVEVDRRVLIEASKAVA